MSEDVSPWPARLLVQDVFRAVPVRAYVYRLFGVTFKRVLLGGVVTSLSAAASGAIVYELSDCSGAVTVFRSPRTKSVHPHTPFHMIESLPEQILSTKTKRQLKVGSFVRVMGDIFVDSSRGVRMVSVCECSVTSPEADLTWMQELLHLYTRYYLKRELLPDVTEPNAESEQHKGSLFEEI